MVPSWNTRRSCFDTGPGLFMGEVRRLVNEMEEQAVADILAADGLLKGLAPAAE
jgi:hypothetical protein